jgi:hypothetical protein
MEELKVLKDNALQAFKEADSNGKTMLTNLFGKKHFLINVMERVKSFEDVCREIGRDPKDPFFSELRPHENANRKMEAWAEALNEGVELSYKNINQKKWRVWVEWDGSGFRLNGVHCDYSYTLTGLGSRTAFASEEKARHFAKYAMDLITESLS